MNIERLAKFFGKGRATDVLPTTVVSSRGRHLCMPGEVLQVEMSTPSSSKSPMTVRRASWGEEGGVLA